MIQDLERLFSNKKTYVAYRFLRRIFVGKWDIERGATHYIESLIWRIIVLIWLLDKAGILHMLAHYLWLE